MRYLRLFVSFFLVVCGTYPSKCSGVLDVASLHHTSTNHQGDYNESEDFVHSTLHVPRTRIVQLDEIDSTQTYVIRNLEKELHNEGDWYVVTANKQTAGIGQNGRKWESSCSGNIYATFATLVSKSSRDEILQTTQIAAYSTCQALASLGLEPRIKWVNDVLIDGKKISGCLCDVVPSQNDDLVYLVIGIGINVNMPEDLLIALPNEATSVSVELEKECDKEVLFSHLLRNLQKNISQLLEESVLVYELEIGDLLITRDEPDDSISSIPWTLKGSKGDWKKKIPIKGGHSKNKRPSTKNKHQVADARRQKEQRKAAEKKQGNKKQKKNR